VSIDIAPEIVGVGHGAPKSGAGARVAAFVAGLLVLLCGAVISLGVVVLAPVGMAIVGYVQRRRGHPLTRGGHWIAASASITLALLMAGGAFVAATPPGAIRSVMNAADSASAVAAKEPPPAWLEKLGPGFSQSNARMTSTSGVAALIGAVIGIGFALGLVSALYGSFGWGAGMLLGLAVTGRWPGTVGAASDEPG
jgi:hypothetical protein